jgi:hypothetical protein
MSATSSGKGRFRPMAKVPPVMWIFAVQGKQTAKLNRAIIRGCRFLFRHGTDTRGCADFT